MYSVYLKPQKHITKLYPTNLQAGGFGSGRKPSGELHETLLSHGFKHVESTGNFHRYQSPGGRQHVTVNQKSGDWTHQTGPGLASGYTHKGNGAEDLGYYLQDQEEHKLAAGGPGSGCRGPNCGRPEGEGIGKIKPIKGKAFNGEPIQLKTQLSKLETGKLGESLILSYLHQQGMKDAAPLNSKYNNYAVDMVQDHGAIEIKTGLVSNSTSAQHWRATIGQPGKEETNWLKKASPEEKREWNRQKAQAILDRKQEAIKELSKELGKPPLKSFTMTTIINPDTRTFDLYRFKGFHLRIPWNSDQAKAGYVGTFKY